MPALKRYRPARSPASCKSPKSGHITMLKLRDARQQSEHPGLPFHNFIAAKSGDRRILFCLEKSCHEFWRPNVVKGSVGSALLPHIIWHNYLFTHPEETRTPWRSRLPGRRRWTWRRRSLARLRSSTPWGWSWWAQWSLPDRLGPEWRLDSARSWPRRWWRWGRRGCRSGSSSSPWNGRTGSHRPAESSCLQRGKLRRGQLV